MQEPKGVSTVRLYLAVLAAVVTAHTLDAVIGHWLHSGIFNAVESLSDLRREYTNHAGRTGTKVTAGSGGKVS